MGSSVLADQSGDPNVFTGKLGRKAATVAFEMHRPPGSSLRAAMVAPWQGATGVVTWERWSPPASSGWGALTGQAECLDKNVDIRKRANRRSTDAK
jgi:hypothetical protein